jgi:hypothetical protein
MVTRTDIDSWFDEVTLELVEACVLKGFGRKQTCSAKGKQLKQEAKNRSKSLSTVCDRQGISFAGAVFQADYYERVFKRRGMLLFNVLMQISDHVLRLASVGLDGTKRQLEVASFGGGPGSRCSGEVGIRFVNHAL